MVKLADHRTIRFDHNSKFLRRLRFIPPNYSQRIYEIGSAYSYSRTPVGQVLECVQEFVHDGDGHGQAGRVTSIAGYEGPLLLSR